MPDHQDIFIECHKARQLIQNMDDAEQFRRDWLGVRGKLRLYVRSITDPIDAAMAADLYQSHVMAWMQDVSRIEK